MTADRWLFYSPNGFGLGDVTQTLALARQIRRRLPEAKFLILTDCEASNLIWREGFASVKMIALHSVLQGLISEESARALNRRTATAAFESFRPDVTVVTNFPTGRSGELAEALAASRQSRKVLVCREKRKSHQESAEFQEALGLYDLVLLPHRPGEVAFEAPSGIEVREMGYFIVRSRDEVLPRAEARRRLGLPEEGFIVYGGFGGGGDRQFTKFLAAFDRLAGVRPDWIFALGLPPYFTGEPPQGQGRRFATFSYFPMAEACSAFDAAITALGNSTMAELMHNGIPAIYVPRRGMDDDHVERAKRIVKARAGWIYSPKEGIDLDRLIELLGDDVLRAEVAENARLMVPENGAERAAEFLLAWLERGPRRSAGS